MIIDSVCAYLWYSVYFVIIGKFKIEMIAKICFALSLNRVNYNNS